MSVTPPDLVHSRISDTTDSIQELLDQSADAEELSLALDTSRRQLKGLVRKNEDLLRTRFLLAEKVSSLENALAKAKAIRHVNHDELTGLPNRRLLRDRFDQAASLANRHDQSVALLFFNLNNFKSVNDNLGRKVGDTLLREIASRLINAIRTSDTTSRHGGDEFVVLLTEIIHPENAVTVLQKIRAQLARPYVFDRHAVRLSISDGMAIYPRDGQRFRDLIRVSENLMFRNRFGRNAEAGDAAKLSTWSHDTGQDGSTD